ncbi:hypothetical protein BKA67DRAFT_537679 [Truncatella angustata]|uniref:Phosphoribosylaminoimidazole-succinocarboxamide synthase n=1 Tax=Truncatella angustata TaxID=152316 RepID=A0A9P8ZW76_9PEZI|nr:uncharacterized protein BKA67DRAFT_537679 [Truncatella angustata]KAH6651827.1 hypothetical protein BKA67DRAFT_537679 [Truncatella angustata]KAH8195243.1 hypothetical protein TruAng_010590 [Truncatella angustata]
MNFQGPGPDYVNENHPNQTYTTNSTNATPPAAATASQVTVLHAPLTQQTFRHESSPSSPPTIVPYVPSPPSTPELDGPDRLFPQETRGTRQAQQTQQPAATYHVAQPPVDPRPLVRFDPRQVTMAVHPPVDWAVSDFKNDLVREVEKSVTPGIDSTPFIQYALETMTQPREDERDVSAVYSSSSEGTNPVFRYLPAAIPGLFQPTQSYLPVNSGFPELEARELTSPDEELAALRRSRQENRLHPEPRLGRRSSRLRPLSGGVVRVPYSDSPEIPAGFQAGGPGDRLRMLDHFDRLEAAASPKRSPRDVINWQSQTDNFADPEKAASYPPLTYRPWILRIQSLSLLAALCVLMIAALMFAAIFSERHNGLTVYSGTLYDGYYFLFRIFPQLLAAVLLLYAQNVITTVFRILPFSALASDDLRSRRNVGFLPLYPKSFLWPQLISTWQVWIPIVITWILNITIPLQSCVFTVVYVGQVWTWSTVQGVAWFLVALYFSMLLATVLLIIYWHNRRTGLVPDWDIRSLADIIVLLAPSNSVQQYAGTETAEKRNDMRHMLYNNIERLGYWRSPDVPDSSLWYGIGVSTNEEKAKVESLGDPVHEKGPRGVPPNFMPFRGDVRTRYLPWCIRDTQISFWAVSATILLVVLFVVCFNPATDVRHGFLPLLSAAPGPGAFSAADFLYSFLPSLLGMVVFLLFQSLDLTLRILTPWGELSHRDGSLAKNSILLDYAACLPLESTWKACRHGHWRVALISLLSTLSILVPVLAGGMFMALTATDHVVRMYPNVAVLSVVLTLLILTLFGIISIIFKRDQFRLPHAVTCLNEIISFCYAEELRADPAFESTQGHRLLKQKLGVYRDNAEQSRWIFGTGSGKQETLGIRRYGKFTGDTPHVAATKQRAKETRDAAGKALRRALERDLEETQRRAISRPVPKGNSTMI